MICWLSDNGWGVEIGPSGVTISRKGVMGSYPTLWEAFLAAVPVILAEIDARARI